jgi:hypothetical protein
MKICHIVCNIIVIFSLMDDDEDSVIDNASLVEVDEDQCAESSSDDDVNNSTRAPASFCAPVVSSPDPAWGKERQEIRDMMQAQLPVVPPPLVTSTAVPPLLLPVPAITASIVLSVHLAQYVAPPALTHAAYMNMQRIQQQQTLRLERLRVSKRELALYKNQAAFNHYC